MAEARKSRQAQRGPGKHGPLDVVVADDLAHARVLTGAEANDPTEHARRRAFVVRAAQRLALPPR